MTEKIKFRPSARHILTIGKGLIKDNFSAIIELIKNAYDADSPYAHLTLEKIGEKHFKITIEDGGHGMAKEDILTKWLVPSTHNKYNATEAKKTPNGRIMQGQKGIGRYAASILGDDFILQTITKDEKNIIKINWSEFEKTDKFLDEISFELISEKNINSSKTGTKISVETTQEDWDKIEKINSLIGELQKLKHPLNKEEFTIKLFLQKFNNLEINKNDNYEELIEALSLLDAYDYNINAKIFQCRLEETAKLENFAEKASRNLLTIISKNNNLFNTGQLITISHYEILDIKNNKSNIYYDYIKNNNDFYCGDIKIKLYSIDLNEKNISETLKKNIDYSFYSVKEFRDVLINTSGVGIYRNNFRIRPYGDNNYDWLGLNERRVNQPTKHIGSRQIAGMVEIQSEEISKLIEKSSREGIKESKEFDLLKDFCLQVLQILEKERNNNSKKKQKKTQERVDAIFNFGKMKNEIENLLENSKIDKKVIKEVASVIQKEQNNKAVEMENLSKEIAVYQTQASMGRLIELLLHEVKKPLGIIKIHSEMLLEDLEEIKKRELSEYLSGINESNIKNALKINKQGISMNNYFEKLKPLSFKRNTKKSIDLIKCINDSVELFIAFFNGDRGNICVNIDSKDKEVINLIAWEQDILLIFNNLLENSIYWLNYDTVSKNNKKINISIVQMENKIIVYFSDNGIGIEEHNFQKIFQWGFSTKPSGTGLGLPLSGDAMKRNNGEIMAIKSSEGALFKLEFNFITN